MFVERVRVSSLRYCPLYVWVCRAVAHDSAAAAEMDIYGMYFAYGGKTTAPLALDRSRSPQSTRERSRTPSSERRGAAAGRGAAAAGAAAVVNATPPTTGVELPCAMVDSCCDASAAPPEVAASVIAAAAAGSHKRPVRSARGKGTTKER